MIKPKYKLFLDNYAISGNIAQSAIKAGFPEQYARKCSKVILNRALKYNTSELLKRSSKNEISASEAKRTPLDILGLTSQDVIKRLKDIAFQDKDYSSALKVLTPVSKSIGYDISNTDTQNTTPSVLNVIVENTNKKKDMIEGEIVDR